MNAAYSPNSDFYIASQKQYDSRFTYPQAAGFDEGDLDSLPSEDHHDNELLTQQDILALSNNALAEVREVNSRPAFAPPSLELVSPADRQLRIRQLSTVVTEMFWIFQKNNPQGLTLTRAA